MDDEESDKSRRRFLQTTGSISLIGLAGCLAPSGGGKHGSDYEKPQDDLTMPEGQENCVSINGIERDPNALTAKEAADYQRSPNYQGDSGNIEMCANCQYFCPVSPPNKVGACSLVDGGIHSQHWCAFWQPTEYVSNLDRRSSGANPWPSEESDSE